MVDDPKLHGGTFKVVAAQSYVDGAVAQQSLWQTGDVVEMARFEIDGVDAVRASVSTIRRKLFDLSGDTPGVAVADDPIMVASVVFDTLQTGPEWTQDTTGYNFRDIILLSKFPVDGRTYRIEYKCTRASGETFFLVFEHPAREVYSV